VNSLVNVATAVGLVTASLLLFLVSLYALQLSVRVLRHWDTRKAPPELKRGSLLGQEIELTSAPSEDFKSVLARLDRRMDTLEQSHMAVLLIVKRVVQERRE
jgi:hypothetical protein